MTAKALEVKLKKLGTKERAKVNAYFFKTGKGEYGEGDKFLGVTVPDTRKAITTFLHLPFSEIQTCLKSPYHEVRLAGVLILVFQYRHAQSPQEEKKIFNFYIKNAPYINNWDLVDSSSEHIVGPYISHHMNHKERLAFLKKGIMSKNFWMNRIVVLSSFYQIKQGNEKLTYFLAPQFFTHTHDLMHKAVGWMLRETGKKVSKEKLVRFLDVHAHKMPRTMLRYAIEHFSKSDRRKFLSKRGV